ncbi:MAG: Mfa1 family fimbria major subunit, partial [Prevotellaceae bacterium]|nr:Mfa1 family fimbria major subunit [Prevotellaceae bacterium]
MMKLKNLTMCVAALLLIGVTSCNKNDSNGQFEAGKPTYLELNVSFQVPQTYATADGNATDTESAVKSVQVYIFETSSALLVSKSDILVATDFTQSANGKKDVYTATKKIETTTGEKSIYVAVNLPTSMDMALGTTIAQMKTAVMTTSATVLANATTGFSMFSTSDITANLVETDDPLFATKNTVTIPVERLTCKVAIQKGSSLILNQIGNGSLSNIQFALKQSNKKIFRFPYLDNGVVIDPNWETFVGTDFEDLTTVAGHEYVNISEASISDNRALTVRYALENTHKYHLQKEVTYASIKAFFVPEEFLDGNGQSKGSNVGNAPKDFWMVTTNDGTKNYFDMESEAYAYQLLPDVAAKSPVKSETYQNGVCYYNLFLNPAGGYNAIRNAFYKATITQIIAPGNPGSEPKDPEQPVEVDTDLNVKFEVIPWDLVEWSQI